MQLESGSGTLRFSGRMKKLSKRFEVKSLDERRQCLYTLLMDTADRRQGSNPVRTFWMSAFQALGMFSPFILSGLFIWFAVTNLDSSSSVAQGGIIVAALILLVSPIFILVYVLGTMVRWFQDQIKFDYTRRFRLGRRKIRGLRLGRGISLQNAGRALILFAVILSFHVLVVVGLRVQLGYDVAGQNDWNKAVLTTCDNLLRGSLFDICEIYGIELTKPLPTTFGVATIVLIFRVVLNLLLIITIVPIFLVWRKGLFEPSLFQHSANATPREISDRLSGAITNTKMLPTLLFLQIAAAYIRGDIREAAYLAEKYHFLPIGKGIKALMGDEVFPGASKEYQGAERKRRITWVLIILGIIGTLVVLGLIGSEMK